MDALKQKLQESGEEFTEKLFKTEDGIRGISGQIFVSCGQNITLYFITSSFVHRNQILGYIFLQCMLSMPETSFAR